MENDLLAIGDVAVDTFIKIKEADIENNKKETKLCFDFGDKIPYSFAVNCCGVGNSANISVCASRLGLKSSLFASIGDDQDGEDSLNSLKREKVGINLIKKETNKKTNHHYVLWYGVDRTILIKHEDFNYSLGGIGKPKWIYLSSIGENSLEFHKSLANYLKENSEIKLAFQPGTFQIKAGIKKMSDIYQKTDIFFCNMEEAMKILSESERNIKKLLEKMYSIGPKIVVLTDGINGAYCFDGENSYSIPIYPHKPYERTGAGDAFAGTVTSALAMQIPLEEALLWGPINSMSVVQKIGAQEGLLNKEEILEYLKNSPTDFRLEKI